MKARAMTLNILFRRCLAVFFLLAIGLPHVADAQMSLYIRGVDVSNFPKVVLRTRIVENNTRVPPVSDDSIAVLENSIFQRATIVCPDQSVSIMLILDKSTSMAFYPNSTEIDPDSNRWRSAKAAVIQFAQQMSPQDEAGFIAFNRSIDLLQPFTSDPKLIADAVSGITLGPYTAVWAAVNSGVNLLATRPNKRAIVVLTDGGDNFSRPLTLQNVIANAQQNNVKVFTVGLGEDVGISALDSLATLTGGMFFYSASGEDLKEIYSKIIQQIPDDCTLTYTTTNVCRDSTLRNITLQLTSRGNLLRADTFYTAPSSVPTVTVAAGKAVFLGINGKATIPITVDRIASGEKPLQFRVQLRYDSALMRFDGTEVKNTIAAQNAVSVSHHPPFITMSGALMAYPDTAFTLLLVRFANKNVREASVAQVRFDSLDFFFQCKTVMRSLNTSVIVDGICQRAAVKSAKFIQQNAPNPFNPTTVIRFVTDKKGAATFRVFDVVGRRMHEEKIVATAGENAILFDGSLFPSGLYFYSIEQENWRETRSMLLMR